MLESPGAYTDVMCKACSTLLTCIEEKQQTVSRTLVHFTKKHSFACVHNGYSIHTNRTIMTVHVLINMDIVVHSSFP